MGHSDILDLSEFVSVQNQYPMLLQKSVYFLFSGHICLGERPLMPLRKAGGKINSTNLGILSGYLLKAAPPPLQSRTSGSIN